MSKETKYKTRNGVSYDKETSDEVIRVLDYVRQLKIRIKVHYGDTKTGRDWNEENGIIGYLGRSTGIKKVPLLIYNSRSIGGGALLDHCIVKIVSIKSKRVLYQHPKYIEPVIEIVDSDLTKEGYTHNTIVNGELYGRHRSLKDAEKLKNKLLF